MDVGVRISQAIVLGYLLDYFKPDSTVTHREAFYYAGAVVALNATAAVFLNQYTVNGYHYGMKVRAACCALIYRKVIRFYLFVILILCHFEQDLLFNKFYKMKKNGNASKAINFP